MKLIAPVSLLGTLVLGIAAGWGLSTALRGDRVPTHRTSEIGERGQTERTPTLIPSTTGTAEQLDAVRQELRLAKLAQGELRSANEALERKLEEMKRESPAITPEESAEQELRQWFTVRSLSPEEMREKLPSSLREGSTFKRLVVSLHQRDVETYIEAAWESKVQKLASRGHRLTPEQDAVAARVFKRNWMKFRTWARRDWMPILQAVRTESDLRVAKTSFAMRLSPVSSDMLMETRKALKEAGLPALTDQLEGFL